MGTNIVRGSGKEMAKRGEVNTNIASEFTETVKFATESLLPLYIIFDCFDFKLNFSTKILTPV